MFNEEMAADAASDSQVEVDPSVQAEENAKSHDEAARDAAADEAKSNEANHAM